MPTTTRHAISSLNGDFGVKIEDVQRSDLVNPTFQSQAYQLWIEHGGLLGLCGSDLQDLTPEQLIDWSAVFGIVDTETTAARADKMVMHKHERTAAAILRIGNVVNDQGEPVAQFARTATLNSNADMQYNPQTSQPVWHTDGTFRPRPPMGSVLYAKQVPPTGGATLFTDTRRAYANLDVAQKDHLRTLEAICSLAHHDQKIHNGRSPNFPVLTAAQRAANPPQRVPTVLQHALTGQPALCGLNGSACAIVPRDKPWHKLSWTSGIWRGQKTTVSRQCGATTCCLASRHLRTRSSGNGDKGAWWYGTIVAPCTLPRALTTSGLHAKCGDSPYWMTSRAV